MSGVLLLVSMFIGISAAEEQDCNNNLNSRCQRILTTLNKPNLYALTRISLPNNNLDSDDFKCICLMTIVPKCIDVSDNNINNINDLYNERLARVYPSLTELNLSNNAFTGEFPLQHCLVVFPNLEVLKINNNKVSTLKKSDETRCMRFTRFTNDSLKIYEAQNTECAKVDLDFLYNNLLNLEQLNLSCSKKLSGFLGISDCLIKSNKIPLKVLLHDVVVKECEMKKWMEDAQSNSTLANAIIATNTILTCALGLSAKFACFIISPQYCLNYPSIEIAYQGTDYGLLVNSMLYDIFLGGMPAIAGYALSRTFVYRCLSNHGKKQAIEFVTHTAANC